MSETVIIKCPGCGTKNRVPADRLDQGPRCGKCKTPLAGTASGPIKFSDANFDSMVNSSRVALVDCWAPWCGPCRMIGPVIEDLAREFGNRALIGKLNVDENPVTAQKYQIRSIPTLLFFKDGRLADTLVGAVPPQQIRQKLETLL